MKPINHYINEALKLGKGARTSLYLYFYHEALEDGYTTEFYKTENTLQYSIDNCKTWNNLDPRTATPEINKGERIYFKGENMKCKEMYGIGAFDSTKRFNVGGNIMSLIYGDNFEGQTKLLKNYQFVGLFIANEFLVSAANLLLPAPKLRSDCYHQMFRRCTSLKEAPKLPATILSKHCYYNMFAECTSLKEAPELPAKKLAFGCYSWMFVSCTSLKKITILATDMSAEDCLNGWNSKVSKTGTFTKAKGVYIPFDKDGYGIPEGWTVKEI